MALVDLWFAGDNEKRVYNCSFCRKNPQTAKERKCEDPGFKNLARPRQVDPKFGLKFDFCPGKATWYPEIAELFMHCAVAMETGVLPQAGAFEDQSDMFVEVFPEFIARWKELQYNRMWSDIRTFAQFVLKSIFGDKKK